MIRTVATIAFRRICIMVVDIMAMAVMAVIIRVVATIRAAVVATSIRMITTRRVAIVQRIQIQWHRIDRKVGSLDQAACSICRRGFRDQLRLVGQAAVRSVMIMHQLHQ